jgi:hypothetical protein
MTDNHITPDTIRAMRARKQKIAALTAYAFPTTRLLGTAPRGGQGVWLFSLKVGELCSA